MGNIARAFEVELPLKVKTYDVDPWRIVHNAVYIYWLEDMRVAMLDAYSPMERQFEEGYGPLILETHIEYKHAIKLFEQPHGRMWVSNLGPLKWMVDAVISVEDRVAAVAQQVGCFVNMATGQPIRMPQDIRQKYQAFLAGDRV